MAAYHVPPLEQLVEQFERLPGIGHKSAQRLAYHILSLSKDEAEAFGKAITNAHEKIHYCKVCANFTDKEVCDICEKENEFKMLYDDFIGVEEKIEKICKEVYHAGNVVYSDLAKLRLNEIKRLELAHLPICISKTQYSISDDPKKLGYPNGHEMFVRDVELYNGAGFITVLMGTTIKMPGLPKVPNYEKICLDEENEIVGLS
jgi:formyltetrahydrofolate synthetase